MYLPRTSNSELPTLNFELRTFASKSPLPFARAFAEFSGMSKTHLTLSLVCSLVAAVHADAADARNLGYTNTPFIPGTPWHVHDGTRPQPRIVTPAATFSHLAPPPGDAIVLFDGTDLSKWQLAGGAAAPWKIENGYMEVAPKSGSIRTKDQFADFQVHIEFATPAKVEGNSQGRG